MHKRIAILGGTFNPVHFGHLRIALECREELQLDKVHLIPCATPPHREAPGVSAAHRINMLKLAVIGEATLIVDDREVQRGGVSYSVDTLNAFKAENSEAILHLIMGSDAFRYIKTWHQWEKLFELAHIIIAKRPDAHLENSEVSDLLKLRLTSNLDNLQNSTAGLIYQVTVSQLEISSTGLRSRLYKGKSLRFLTPNSVLDYITNNNLYQN